MKIVAYNKCSLLDYHPYLSVVVFTPGCNMNCTYCHNRDLLYSREYIEEDLILAHLQASKMLEALVISGGEPTLQGQELIDFLQKVRSAFGSASTSDGKLRIKLDTNGSNPSLLSSILDQGLVDFVAMDIKATPDKYRQICGLPFSQVKDSIAILRNFGAYEFRTTVYPEITLDELEMLCRTHQTDNYYLQQYRRVRADGMIPYDKELLRKIADKYNVRLRGV